jgi:NADPH:quinone reductase-like Zn-dependent oxidoreductase
MAKAVAFSGYGGPEVLELIDVEPPSPGPGQALVRVRASGVNAIDWKLRKGLMAAVRPLKFPYVGGIELSGVVEAVGEGVTDVQPGDEVLGPADAAYAEYAVARADHLAKKPAEMSWELAAALPVAAETAQRTLSALAVKAGDTLLIHAAAGGVGSIATQFAVASGVAVVGTASEANHDYLRSLGATPVTYGEGLVQRVRDVAPQGVTAALDASGRGVLPDSVELTGDPQQVVTIADPSAGAVGARFSSGLASQEDYTPAALARVLDLFRAGTLKLEIWQALPLAEAATAQRASEEGHLRGKAVLLA